MDRDDLLVMAHKMRFAGELVMRLGLDAAAVFEAAVREAAEPLDDDTKYW